MPSDPRARRRGVTCAVHGTKPTQRASGRWWGELRVGCQLLLFTSSSSPGDELLWRALALKRLESSSTPAASSGKFCRRKSFGETGGCSWDEKSPGFYQFGCFLSQFWLKRLYNYY